MDEQLKQLVLRVQQFPPETKERQHAVSELVDRILRSRRICRPFKGEQLAEIDCDIVQAACRRLNHEVEQRIDHYNLQQTPIREWSTALLGYVFQQVLDETHLRQLALEVQQQSPRTEMWQYRMNTLLQALQLSGKLYRPPYGQFALDVYDDAVTRTLLFVHQNLNAYDPYRGKFLSWVNYRLKMTLLDVRQELKDPLIQAIDGRVIRLKYQLSALIKRTKAENVVSYLMLDVKGVLPMNPFMQSIILVLLFAWLLSQLIGKAPQQADRLLFELAKESIAVSFKRYEVTSEVSDLENMAQPQESPLISETIRDYIQADPNQRCQKHVKNRPEATFQCIALARLNGKTWKELSEALAIDIPTLSNFFQRRLKELAPEIRTYVQESLD
ncbi:MAG: hypothetical protein Kow00121_50510 [Elainellaceae cyanobacterium]